MTPRFVWSRYTGYECSSRGDARFSAFQARLDDGRTIEEHYQCDVKGYDVGGTNWRLGKGKPPLRPLDEDALWEKYLNLWRQWADTHEDLLEELAFRSYGILSDQFATTPVNQAHALTVILNERGFVPNGT